MEDPRKQKLPITVNYYHIVPVDFNAVVSMKEKPVDVRDIVQKLHNHVKSRLYKKNVYIQV